MLVGCTEYNCVHISTIASITTTDIVTFLFCLVHLDTMERRHITVYPSVHRPLAEISECIYTNQDSCTNIHLLNEAVRAYVSGGLPLNISEFFETAQYYLHLNLVRYRVTSIKWWVIAWSPNGNTSSCIRCINLMMRLWELDHFLLIDQEFLYDMENYEICELLITKLHDNHPHHHTILNVGMATRFNLAYEVVTVDNAG